MAEANIKYFDYFNHDVINIENGTVAMAEAMGCKVCYSENEPPKLLKPVLTNLKDVYNLKSVNPYKDGTLPEVLEATSRVAEQLGKEVFIIGEGDQGPFSLAAMLRGPEQFLIDLVEEENSAEIEYLLNFCTSNIKAYLDAQIKSGAHATSIGDSLSGPDVVSPDF